MEPNGTGVLRKLASRINIEPFLMIVFGFILQTVNLKTHAAIISQKSSVKCILFIRQHGLHNY